LTIFSFDLLALWSLTLSTKVPESPNWNWPVSQPGVKSLSHCPHLGTGKMG